VTQAASSRLRWIHKRALWSTLRAAQGNLERAAHALGVTPVELRDLLEGDPAAMWDTRSEIGISGMRRRVVAEDYGGVQAGQSAARDEDEKEGENESAQRREEAEEDPDA
jgi:hypothetical protein